MHPGLEKEKLSELSEDDIVHKITDLQRRMGIAYQTGRTEVVAQLQLLIDHYQDALNERILEEQQKLIDADPKWGRTVIDIDWPDPNAEAEEEEKKKSTRFD